MVLIVNQQPHSSVNHINNLCIVIMHLLLILSINLLDERYLCKEIDALGENLAMLVMRESCKILKDPETSMLTIISIR